MLKKKTYCTYTSLSFQIASKSNTLPFKSRQTCTVPKDVTRNLNKKTSSSPFCSVSEIAGKDTLSAFM